MRVLGPNVLLTAHVTLVDCLILIILTCEIKGWLEVPDSPPNAYSPGQHLKSSSSQGPVPHILTTETESCLP